MSDKATLIAEERTGTGTAESKRMRRSGRLPCVVYGQSGPTRTISVDSAEFNALVAAGYRVIKLSLGGESGQVMLKDVQYSLMGDDIVHADFIRIAAGEKITVTVAVELVGTAKGTKGAGILEQPLKEIEIECLPSAIPKEFAVNVIELDVDDIIRVKDVKMPAGVTSNMDPEAIVAQVVIREDEEEPEKAEGVSMPEVIGEKKEEGEGEAEEKK